MVTLKWLTEKEVSKMIGRAAQTLRNDRMKRRGIPYCKAGRSVRYRLDDVMTYMNQYRITFSETEVEQ
ncbi:MAG: helix-turn-helix domain-containing protein [Bacteroidetes bacterium]|nr:helix-turn-helix domain-containing protein [Bacteroidota bacterium]